MFRSVCLSLILILGFAILGCKNKTVEPGVKPGAIRLIHHGADTDWTEKGIDADSETDGIYLSWFSPKEDDIDYVEIYRSREDETDFEQLTKIYSPDTSYVDNKVVFHKRYSYYVIPVNEDGQKGVSSDTLFYTLLEKAKDFLPKGSTDSVTPTFSWRDPNSSPVFSLIFKLIEAANETLIWNTVVENTGGDSRMNIVYNFDGTAQISELRRGVDYLWRIDLIGPETNSGSESGWTPLTVQ